MLKDNFSIEQTRKTLKKTNPVSTVVILFLLMQVPGVIIDLLLSHMLLESKDYSNKLANADFFLLATLFTTLFIALLAYLFARYYQKRNKESLGLTSSEKLKSYLKGLLIGIFMILAVAFVAKLTGFAEISLNTSKISWSFFIIFVLGWIIQGFEEELITRSILMNFFAVNNGVIGGIIINSLLFAILHMGNTGFGILAFINIMLMGILFSLLFYISDNIFFPAAAHSFWNFAQANIFGMSVSGMDEVKNTIFKTKLMGGDIISGGAFGFEGSIFVTLVEIIMIFVIIKIIKRRNLYLEKIN
ncbi:CPBP family intramembrane glutamic endopeptidase [Anaerococcus sp. Marseille-Q7828]|uniref:CPBP family intramembrane glutamic endopeptidase n=1 Tax=Anaerococcus sp. Marseille-Q7828 TaxID=3036300 RepID=UPI0024AD9F9D|nr:CPBP family intramembrane glutamic endopeptidase [Anaerococcus sp. Marseille-Q7828]